MRLDNPIFTDVDAAREHLKRSAGPVVGVYQHCCEAHLHRYLAEYGFRYNRRSALKLSDSERHDMLLAMIDGKRLTYRRIGEAHYA